MRAPSLASLVALLASCASAPPPPPPERIGVAVGPPLVAVTASATATAAPAAPPPPAVSPYFTVIGHGGPFHVHPLGTGAAVVSGWDPTLLFVDDRGARIEPRLTKGVTGRDQGVPAYVVKRVSGDWPRSGSLEVNIPGPGEGTDVVWEWRGSSWVKAPVQPLGDMPDEVRSAYSVGSYYGKFSWQGRSFYSVSDSDAASGGYLTRFFASKSSKAAPPPIAKGAGPCTHRLTGYAFLREAPSGDLLGLGKLCTRKEDHEAMSWKGPGALAVERWRKGAATSTIEPLPASEGKGSLYSSGGGLVARSATDVFVYADLQGPQQRRVPYVAHHDGKAWTDVSPAADEGVAEAWADAEGSLWLRLDSALMRRKGGAWEKLAPQGAQGSIVFLARAPDGMPWARFGDELWHFGAAGAWERAVLPSGPSGEPLVADGVTWLSSGNMLIAANGAGDAMLLASVRPEKVFEMPP